MQYSGRDNIVWDHLSFTNLINFITDTDFYLSDFIIVACIILWAITYLCSNAIRFSITWLQLRTLYGASVKYQLAANVIIMLHIYFLTILLTNFSMKVIDRPNANSVNDEKCDIFLAQIYIQNFKIIMYVYMYLDQVWTFPKVKSYSLG